MHRLYCLKTYRCLIKERNRKNKGKNKQIETGSENGDDSDNKTEGESSDNGDKMEVDEDDSEKTAVTKVCLSEFFGDENCFVTLLSIAI